jgi:hypothetical protein
MTVSTLTTVRAAIPGGAIGILSRPAVTGENPANHVFVDLNVERQGHLLGVSRTAPVGITLLHFDDRTDEVYARTFRAGLPAGDPRRTASGAFSCSWIYEGLAFSHASGGVGRLLHIHCKECPRLSGRDPKSQSGKPSNGGGPECLIRRYRICPVMFVLTRS